MTIITDPKKINTSPPGSKYFVGWAISPDYRTRVVIYDWSEKIETKVLIAGLRATGDISGDNIIICNIDGPKEASIFIEEIDTLIPSCDALIFLAKSHGIYRILIHGFMRGSFGAISCDRIDDVAPPQSDT